MVIQGLTGTVAARFSAAPSKATSGDGVQLSAEAVRALLTPGAQEVQPGWNYRHGTNLIGPAVLSADGNLVFQSGTDQLLCLTTGGDGTPLWKNEDAFCTQAVVGPTGLVYAGTEDSKLHALDPITGHDAWSIDLPGSASDLRKGPAGELVVTARGRTLGLKTEDGSTLWSSPVTGREMAVTPTGQMVAAGDGLKCVVGYDRDSGQELWRKSHGHCRHRPVVGADGTVYLGNVAGRFMALDPATGDIKWSYDTGSHILESPTVGPDGTVYAGNLGGKLFAFDPVKRDKKWEIEVGSEVRVPVGIGGDGTLLLASDRNVVVGYEPEHGGKSWSQAAASFVHCTPVSNDQGTLVFGANNATLYTYKTPTLRLQLDALTKGAPSTDGAGLGYAHGRLLVGQSTLQVRRRHDSLA